MTRAIGLKWLLRGAVFAGAVSVALSLPQAGARAAETYVIQLASFKSKARAEAAWKALQRKQPNLLAGLSADIVRANLGARGIFYRLRAGPFPNRATAQDMCWQLRPTRPQDCLVRRR
ncbi:MAG: SPOR domain-containing protein [Kiloniellaceae bacterium]